MVTAPTARSKVAQGNALGFDATVYLALKGRSKALALEPIFFSNLLTMLSTGRMCTETDSLSFVTFNVLPYRGTTLFVASFLKEHSRDFSRSFKRFLLSGNFLEKLSYLVLERASNFVFAPSLFDQFSAQQKEECRRLCKRNIGDNKWEPDYPNLKNIFKGVT
jgi:hypothetical protein